MLHLRKAGAGDLQRINPCFFKFSFFVGECLFQKRKIEEQIMSKQDLLPQKNIQLLQEILHVQRPLHICVSDSCQFYNTLRQPDTRIHIGRKNIRLFPVRKFHGSNLYNFIQFCAEPCGLKIYCNICISHFFLHSGLHNQHIPPAKNIPRSSVSAPYRSFFPDG